MFVVDIIMLGLNGVGKTGGFAVCFPAQSKSFALAQAGIHKEIREQSKIGAQTVPDALCVLAADKFSRLSCLSPAGRRTAVQGLTLISASGCVILLCVLPCWRRGRTNFYILRCAMKTDNKPHKPARGKCLIRKKTIIIITELSDERIQELLRLFDERETLRS